MKKSAESSYLIALDIAEKLVKNGIPFRTTHKIAGSLVQIAHNSKKPLHKLDIQEITQVISDNQVEPQMLQDVIQNTSIQSSLKERKSFGSSGYEEQKRMIEDRIKKINSYRTIATKQQNEVSKAFDTLSNKVKEFTR